MKRIKILTRKAASNNLLSVLQCFLVYLAITAYILRFSQSFYSDVLLQKRKPNKCIKRIFLQILNVCVKTYRFEGNRNMYLHRPINFCNEEIILHYFTPSFSIKPCNFPGKICKTGISRVYQLFSLTKLQKAFSMQIFSKSRDSYCKSSGVQNISEVQVFIGFLAFTELSYTTLRFYLTY